MHDFIELYAGIGHPRVAFRGRLNCVYASDFSEAKAAVYRDNFGGDELVVKDIRDIAEGELPRSYMWWLSSPCTDFTSAGLGKGMEGPQGALIFQTTRLLHAALRQGTAPSVVVMENVERLVTISSGAVFTALVTALVSAGYVVGAVMMDAADFLPQSRPRFFLVAVRRGVAIPAALIAGGPIAHWHSAALVRAVGGLRALEKENWVWWRLPVPPARKMNLSDIVEPLGSPNLAWRDPGNVEYLLGLLGARDKVRLERAQTSGKEVYGTVANKPGKNGERYLALRTDGTAGCLMCKVDIRYQQFCRIMGEHVGIRPATRLEMGRSMGLPDSFKLPASVAATAKACGDGVVVPVIEWLLTHLLEPLLEAADQSTKKDIKMTEGKPQLLDRPLRKRNAADPVLSTQPVATRAGAITVSFEPGELDRMFRFAAEAGVSLHEFVLRGMDRNLAEFGAPPVRRQTPAPAVQRSKAGGTGKVKESDIATGIAWNRRRTAATTARVHLRDTGLKVAAQTLPRVRKTP